MHERIACIGGATLDRRIEPLGRLLPGTSNPVRSETAPGGSARNIAEALGRLGCPVTLFSRVGADAAAEEILDGLNDVGLRLDGVDRVTSAPTASYTAVLDEQGELAMGLADMAIFDHLDHGWLDPITLSLQRHRIWIVDANLPAAVLKPLADLASDRTRILADPVSVEKARRLAPILDRVDVLFPDRAEAAALAGAEPGLEPTELAARLRERGAGKLIVTLGSEGVWVDDPPRHAREPAITPREVVDVTGAGDCLLAGYVFAGVVGAALDPVRCGLAAAALAVESPRPVPPELTAERLLQRYEEGR